MLSNKSNEEPAILALQSFSRNDYKTCLDWLNKLERLLGHSTATIQHNKALVEFMNSDMKNIEMYRNTLSELLDVSFPETESNNFNHISIWLNYAIVLYHARYFTHSQLVLEKLLEKYYQIKELNIRIKLILLMMEVLMALKSPDKVIQLAKAHPEIAKCEKNIFDIYQRIIYRANMMLNCKIPYTNSKNTIQWVFLLAHHQYLNRDFFSASNTLGLYKKFPDTYTMRNHGEDIWAPINNNLGVIYLLLNKPCIAVKYIQVSLKEYFKSCNTPDVNRLVAVRDRPIYIFNLGLALLRANRPEGAFEFLVEAIRHFPNNPLLWLRLAECCVKHLYNNNSQKLLVKKIGSGPHTHFLLSNITEEKYSTSGDSFAIPSLSLEFAALCLRNAIALIPAQEPPTNPNALILQVAPSTPLTWKQRCHLKNCIFILNSFVLLKLKDPLASLKFAKDVINPKEGLVSNSHKALANLYAADALIQLDRTNEAIEHLKPQMIHDIVSVLSPQMQDKIGVGIWANTAICHILKGDMITAGKILSQINSQRILPLLLYMELCAGRVDSCHNILQKLTLDTA